MSFNSWQFLLFLPIVITVYYLLPHKVRWVWLLAASYFFYMFWNAVLIFLIVGTTLVSYGSGLLMERSESVKVRKFLLITTIIICLGVLVFFKYFNFIMGNAIDFLNLFSLNIKSFSLDLLLPIGISFYTFQTLSYVIDVYRGTVRAEKHLGYYALFVSFFPQLVAGPIERPANLIPQLKEKHKLNWEDFSCGIRILAVGFFYKCVVADFVGIFVNRVFADVAGANGLSVLLAGFLFTVQMYCDFAGYSEIATGAARIMGVKLCVNFNRPYMSKSYSDFFRRWHISLTSWFTDYVYIPLGGNRRGPVRRVLNVFIVFILCGLWHGANWTFVVWGAYAAFFLSLETLVKRPIARLLTKMNVNPDGKGVWWARVIGMYFILIPAAIIFRAEDLSHAGQLLSTLFTSWNLFSGSYFAAFVLSLGLTVQAALQILFCIVCEVAVWKYAEIGRHEKDETLVEGGVWDYEQARRTVVLALLIICVTLSWIGLLSTGDSSQFKYFQF